MTLDELYASLEAGDVPLAVVADWYEDAGSELAAGVRWLAKAGRMPRRAYGTWHWTFYYDHDPPRLAAENPDGLPHDVWGRALTTLGNKNRTLYHPTLRAAIEAAAEAVTGVAATVSERG